MILYTYELFINMKNIIVLILFILYYIDYYILTNVRLASPGPLLAVVNRHPLLAIRRGTLGGSRRMPTENVGKTWGKCGKSPLFMGKPMGK